MEEFDETEVIRSSEFQENPDRATLKFLRREFDRLVVTTEEQSEKCDSMVAMLVEVTNTVSQLCNQLGIHPIDTEFSQHVPPVTNFSDPYVHDDVNRVSLDYRKSLSHKIAMPEFDDSNASDWLLKVERFFSVDRYSDLDKLDLVAFSLEGDVLRWFNWEMSRREFRSWDEFRRRLLLRFGTAPAESPGNRRFAIKPTETVYAQVTAQQPVHKEESVTHLQVPVSKLEHGLQIHNESPHLCENYQDVVGCDELGKEEKMFSGLSQTSQVWEPGGVLASVNVADSLGEKASYTEKKLILQYQEMDSTNGTGADVESANGANGANGVGDIDALPPPPPILAPNVEPLHVKTEPVEKKNLRVPMARKGFGTKGQKIPLLTNHFKVDVAGLQGHFYHYNVALANAMRGQESENCEEVGGNILGCRGLGQLSLDNLRLHVWHKWKSKPVTECKTSDAIFQLVLERSVSHDCLLGSLGEKKNVSWLAVVCVLAERMMRKVTVISAKLPETWRGRELVAESGLQAVLEQIIRINWNLMLLEFFLFIHLEDKVCLSGASNSWCGWRVFDRGKYNIISGDVIILVFLDLKKCFFHGAEKRDVQTMLLEKAKDAHVDSLIVWIKELWIANMVEINTGVSWAELKWIIWSVSSNIVEAYTKIIDKLQIKLKQGMDLHGASWHCVTYAMKSFHSPIGLVDALQSEHMFLRLFLRQHISSSIWHRWRRKTGHT